MGENFEFESIKPLIQNVEQDGGTLVCVFKCPVTGMSFTGEADIDEDDSSSAIPGATSRAAYRSMSRHLKGAIRSVFGYSTIGLTLTDIADALGFQSWMKYKRKLKDGKKPSEKVIRDTIVRCFEEVSDKFTWDDARKGWVAKSAARELFTEFELQIQNHPVSAQYDKVILSRMLAEIIKADGVLEDKEKDFIKGFLPPEAGTMDKIVNTADITEAELKEVSQGKVRETMIMLAWAAALVDEELADAEKERLEFFEQKLGIDKNRSKRLAMAARDYLLDKALNLAYPGGAFNQDAFEQIMTMASKLGIPKEEADRVHARYKKRRNIF